MSEPMDAATLVQIENLAKLPSIPTGIRDDLLLLIAEVRRCHAALERLRTVDAERDREAFRIWAVSMGHYPVRNIDAWIAALAYARQEATE